MADQDSEAEMTGAGPWADSFAKAKRLVDQMKMEEKVWSFCHSLLLVPFSGIPQALSISSWYRSNLSRSTLQLNMTGGVPSNTSCSGMIPGIPRLNFPGLCLSDAGNGLRNTDFVSSWPSGIHVGASWNKALARQRGAGMGGEFRTKGVNVLLGPVVGPLGRVVLSGRNWEGMLSVFV